MPDLHVHSRRRRLRAVSQRRFRCACSSSGGKLAVELALDVMKGASCVFIGDFNNAGAKAVEVARTVKDAFAVMPITASAKGVPFTQWTHGVRSLQSDPALQIVGTGHDFVPNPNGCIDFALGSGLIQCVAVNALVGLSAADVGQIMMTWITSRSPSMWRPPDLTTAGGASRSGPPHAFGGP